MSMGGASVAVSHSQGVSVLMMTGQDFAGGGLVDEDELIWCGCTCRWWPPSLYNSTTAICRMQGVLPVESGAASNAWKPVKMTVKINDVSDLWRVCLKSPHARVEIRSWSLRSLQMASVTWTASTTTLAARSTTWATTCSRPIQVRAPAL